MRRSGTRDRRRGPWSRRDVGARFWPVHATYLATISKHDIAGIVLAVEAAVLVLWGVVRLAAKAAEASLLLVGAVVVAVVAVLMFTRAI